MQLKYSLSPCPFWDTQYLHTMIQYKLSSSILQWLSWHMLKHGCVHRILPFWSHFLCKICSSTSSSLLQFEGFPHGSVFSTTLFFISVNGLVSALPSGIWSSLFMYESAIFVSHPTIPALRQLLQSAITCLLLGHSKTFSILFFSFTYRPPTSSSIWCSTPVLLFGLFLTLHCHDGILFSLSKKKPAITSDSFKPLYIPWVSDCKTLLYLHITLILSTLNYGCHIYSAHTSLLTHLGSVHHCGLRLVLGAFWSSPVENLYAESGLPSLYWFLSMLVFSIFTFLPN